MEPVDVLGRVYGVDHGVGIDLIGQGKLYEYPVDGGIVVQLVDDRQQVFLRRIDGERLAQRIHAGFDGLFVLVAHIDLARGIFPDQHRGETGHHPMTGFQICRFFRDAGAQAFGEALAVDNTCLSHFPCFLPFCRLRP